MIQKIVRITLFSFFIGLLLFTYHHNLIIIQWPWYSHKETPSYQRATKKTVNLHYWQNDAWHTEKNKLIMADDSAHAITYLINSWLTLLYEEKIMDKKVELETALLSSTGQELFISFDRTPLSSQQSIYEKWMWIEGLLKTIKEYDATINYVHILVRHKPLHDAHLDVTHAWPMSGFIRQ